MKKIIFLFMIFSSLLIAQNFTIPSLTQRTIVNNDLLLMSENATANYYKTTLTALQQHWDDEAWTWTGTQWFQGTLTLGAASSTIRLNNNSRTPSISGEIAPSSTYAYLLFRTGSVIDTLLSWRQFYLGDNTTYGYWDFNGNGRVDGNWDFYGDPAITPSSTLTNAGIIDNSTGGVFIIGTDATGNTGGSIFRYNLTRDLLAYHYNEASGIDTLASQFYCWSNFAFYNQSNDWGGTQDFTSSSGLIVPSAGTTDQGAIWTIGGDGSGLMKFTYGTGANQNDTIPSYRYNRSADHDFYGQLDYKPQTATLDGGSAAFNVTANTLILTGGVASTITNFTGASEGCILYIHCTTAGFTIQDNDVNIDCDGDVNLSVTINDTVQFQLIGTTWKQISQLVDLGN